MWNPRVGGEKARCSVTGAKFWGSPPRGRGKGDFHIVTHTKVGITPAWAGKSFFCVRCAALSTDHPRVGGEKVTGLAAPTIEPGSPPHGRGKEASIFDDGQRLGITPA